MQRAKYIETMVSKIVIKITNILEAPMRLYAKHTTREWRLAAFSSSRPHFKLKHYLSMRRGQDSVERPNLGRHESLRAIAETHEQAFSRVQFRDPVTA